MLCGWVDWSCDSNGLWVGLPLDCSGCVVWVDWSCDSNGLWVGLPLECSSCVVWVGGLVM